MEGAGHRGRWNKKAPVGTMLLLMCMFIPTRTLVQPTEKLKCPPGDYFTKGICCNKCPQGFKMVEDCRAEGMRTNCTHCPPGQYQDQLNFSPNCRSCRRCKATKHELEFSACEGSKDTVCHCEPGYYKYNIDSETYECRRCSRCGPDEKEQRTCTTERNTECECKENFYKVKRKCEACKVCSAECKLNCPSPTVQQGTTDEAKKLGNDHIVNIIAGVSVVFVVSLGLVVLITHMVTKRSTKQKLLKTPSQPSDFSPNSSEHLTLIVEPADDRSVTAVHESPASEQEPHNLPDCVPLEVKIPALIYTVLDQVPVQQMKQLVRSLGVKDTEIEQAETDHRLCREAHYQMLRVWAETGARAAGGGRGTTLHWPLLQELLDELRKMHLGRAAEELETKYGIQ